jgi:16S rRNA (cytosine1402-N4)-methyltransferase
MEKYQKRHIPAFKGGFVKLLKLKKGQLLLDCTLGDGTHTQEALEEGIKVISLDLDPDSIKRARYFIPKELHKNWKVVNANFASISSLKIATPDAILMDLGTSQNQLNKASKGFSFSKPAPLDMRFDKKNQAVTAADLINGLSYKELSNLFYTLSDEVKSRPIAAAIINARRHSPIKTTTQLAKIIEQVKGQGKRIHAATKVFQALRMAVNLERENLRLGLNQAFDILSPQGRLAVISFHSGEDRIVKEFFKKKNENKEAFLLVSKPLMPTKKETIINNKIRSAKLRLLQKK